MNPKPKFRVTVLSVLTGLAVTGCGSSQPQHSYRPPDPPGSYQVPRTKEEKIAAINRANVSEDMKKAAIAKVNAGP